MRVHLAYITVITRYYLRINWVCGPVASS